MQYLLTPEEYKNLIEAKKLAEMKVAADMQTLCTEVANLKPITRPWENEHALQRPWGCILTLPSPKYCDECPVKKVCPHPHKIFSK